MKGERQNFLMPKFFSSSLKLNTATLLIFLFILALGIRFLYFPGNIYFGFDQARDAFESQDIYKNLNFKIIGPSTAATDLFHGPLYWYVIGIPYLVGGGDPAWAAGFLLILNAVGVFLIFYTGKVLFNSKVGLIAATLYAVSFEEVQYALYFGNPSPAVLTVMLFYVGLALAIFRRDWRGLPISLLGLGLSIQFEFFLLYLVLVFLLTSVLFRRTVLKLLNVQRILVSSFTFLISISTFIIADFKFGFRTVKTLSGIFGEDGGSSEFTKAFGLYAKRLVLQVHDNLFPFENIDRLVLILLLCVALFWVIKRRDNYRQIIFLLIWILSTSILLVFGAPTLYYSNIGIAAGVLLLTSFFISLLRQKSLVLTTVLVVAIGTGNLFLTRGQNPKGVINDIYVQEGMLLGRERRVIDFIYESVQGKSIVVAALTMPLKINTTWAYLFNWYGKEKYGYLPYWAGEAAVGYPGSLPSWQSQKKDYIMFSIIEPTRGVRQAFVEQFLEEQKQYGEVVEEKIFGDNPYTRLVVQKRR